ncbi:MAG TPA: cysteine desulfurase family protein [Thermoanaerobaculia bacterium]|nr:cysteine desulfurase family protein [Thermoanaerobaculia bacterium]
MIYLDNNASTKLDSEVEEAMARAMAVFGNPSSVHGEGRLARRLVEEARDEVAALIGAAPEEVFFTSGGTESNALAVFGGAAAAGPRARVVISGAEHPSVREAAEALAGEGAVVVRVNPDPSGALDAAKVLEAAGPGPAFVSVMAANNEYGALFPVAEIGAALRERGGIFHTDAVQAAGRIPVSVREWGADLATVSAHKMHGPKGTGALYIRKGLRIPARTPGGGQEKKIRAGTENTGGIAGFGAAARFARARLGEAEEIGRLRDRFERGILERVEGARAVGAQAPRLPNTTAILFEGAPAEALLIRLDLDGVAASAGSACSSGTLAPSPAILSLGLTPERARSVLRFSLSRFTTAEEIEAAVEIVSRAASEARVQSG